MKRMKGKGGSGGWILFAVVLIAAFLIGGGSLSWQGQPITGSSILGGGQTLSVSQTGAAACAGGQTQSYDPNAYDKLNPATAFTESTNIYRKVGDKAWTEFTQGTAITGREVGANYEFIYGINTIVL